MNLRRLGVVSGVLLLGLSGCSDNAPTTGPSATTAATSGGDECAGVVRTVQDKLSRPGIQGVTVEGGCTTVVIATTLSSGDASTAKQLCDLAAEVAYTGSVNAIRVLGDSSKELANGVKGAKCLAAG